MVFLSPRPPLKGEAKLFFDASHREREILRKRKRKGEREREREKFLLKTPCGKDGENGKRREGQGCQVVGLPFWRSFGSRGAAKKKTFLKRTKIISYLSVELKLRTVLYYFCHSGLPGVDPGNPE